jgi:hypothetical protein
MSNLLETLFWAMVLPPSILAMLLLPIVLDFRWIRWPPIVCQSCGYSRAGLAERQPCPECNSEFPGPKPERLVVFACFWRRAPVAAATIVTACVVVWAIMPDLIWIGPHRAAKGRPGLQDVFVYVGISLALAYALAVTGGFLPMLRGFILAAWGLLTPIATIHAGAAIFALAFPRADIDFFGMPFFALFTAGHALGWSIGWHHQRHLAKRAKDPSQSSANPTSTPTPIPTTPPDPPQAATND